MTRKKKRKYNLPGRYCWSCDRRRPNEKFAGRGHAHQLCRECAQLGAEELAYRQALRNLDRCMTWEGIIPRKRHKSFERFLHHDDPRIRARAKEMLDEGAASRASPRTQAELNCVVSESDKSLGDHDHSTQADDDEGSTTAVPF